MTNRGAAAALNAVLWGSGYLYSRRGGQGAFALIGHIILYYWVYVLASDWLFWGPIMIPTSLFFAIDGYRNAGSTSGGRSEPSSFRKKMVCESCGSQISQKTKFCPECGAKQ